jgi:F-type H+-transporting ATPase subunit b
MKLLGVSRNDHTKSSYTGTGGKILMVALILLLTCFVGTALAAGKGWVKTDWFRLMNFSVLAIGLFFILKKPVSQALNARIEGIKKELSDLENQKKEAEEKLAEYNEIFSKLDKEVEELVAEYVKQGEQAKEKILKEAETVAVKLEEQARKNIENEFKRAKKELHAEVLDMALSKAEEIIKAKISPEDQDRLVDDYLKKVVA